MKIEKGITYKKYISNNFHILNPMLLVIKIRKWVGRWCQE